VIQQVRVAGRHAAPLARLLAEAGRRLAAAGVPSARNDAEVLAAQAFGVPRARLPLAAPDAAALAEFHRLVAERSRRVPLQYLTGRAGFHRIEVAVGPGVFVPRPETELLAEWAIEAARTGRAGPPPPTVVDLCAGSGAIALAVRGGVPRATVVAVEADPAAFRWLLRNAGRAVVCARADARRGLGWLAGRADVVVSNPPYLPAAQRAAAPPEVAEHEPPVALWVDGDGLSVLRAVARQAARLLRPGGAVGIEHADDQASGALDALRAAGFGEVTDHPDLAGRPRFVTGRWPGPSASGRSRPGPSGSGRSRPGGDTGG
jgi:release factor glutamine methyltransferase